MWINSELYFIQVLSGPGADLTGHGVAFHITSLLDIVNSHIELLFVFSFPLCRFFTFLIGQIVLIYQVFALIVRS